MKPFICWQFEFPWLNLTNCRNKWMVIRNDPVTVKHTKWIFTDVGKVMMAFILGYRFWFHCLYEQNGPFLETFFTPMAFLEYNMIFCRERRPWLTAGVSSFQLLHWMEHRSMPFSLFFPCNQRLPWRDSAWSKRPPLVTALPEAWRYRVSTETGWHGVGT